MIYSRMMKSTMVKIIVLVIVASFITMHGVYAAGKNYGHGNRSCADYVSKRNGFYSNNAKESFDMYLYLSWVAGYATVISTIYEIDVLKGKDFDQIAIMLERYCQKKPSTSFHLATSNVFADMHKPK